MQVIARSAEESAMELLVADLRLPGDPWQRGRDTASFELPGRIKCTQKGKARKYDVLRLPRQRTRRALSALRVPASLLWSSPQRARWRVLACGLFGDKDVRLMKRLAAARGGVGLRRHRHGDQERAERCAGAVPLFLRGGLAYGVLILNLQPEAGFGGVRT